MTIKDLYPNSRANLILDFANSKQLDGRITFTRASSAVYYDCATTAKAEENLLLRSQEFNVSPWSIGNTGVSITPNADTAPDGTTTADFLNEGTSASQFHFTQQSITKLASSQTFVFSFHAKAVGDRQVAAAMADGTGSNGVAARFSTIAGTVVAQTGTFGTGFTAISATITSLPNGWYRCSLGCTTNTNTTLTCQVSLYNITLATNVYTGDGTSGTYLWGAQLEQRSTMNVYTVTTTAAITTYEPALLTASANQARFDHDPVTRESLGLLIEEQRTNSVTNPRGEGVVAGSTGTLPTNWSEYISPNAGSPTRTITELWTVGDVKRLRFTYSGTATGAGEILIFFGTNISASPSQTWTLSSFVGLVSATNISLVALRTDKRDASFNYLRATFGSNITGAVSRRNYTFTTGASTAWLGVMLSIYTTAAGAYQVTVDVYLPQLELGSFITSAILPPVGSVGQSTRQADVVTMTATNFSSWYRQDEGTFVTEASVSAYSSSSVAEHVVARPWDGTANNLLSIRSLSSGTGNLNWDFAGSTNGTEVFNLADTTVNTVNEGVYQALAVQLNDVAGVVNAGTVSTDTSVTLPLVDRMLMGAVNIHIRRVRYYQSRLTNAQLQALTK